MTNQLSQWYQYPNAYSKDNSHYTYMMDDGSAVTLTAGKDGVTEDWIAQIKAYHIEEMNMLRRGRSKGEGQNKLLSLTQFENDAEDKSLALADPNSDVEANYIDKIDAAEKRDKIKRALQSLTPDQFELLIRVRVKGESVTQIASEDGVGKPAICNRMKKIEEKIQKFL